MLTKEDWTEIYYAVQYKRDHSAACADDPKWKGQLTAIMDTIGPDGDEAAGWTVLEQGRKINALERSTMLVALRTVQKTGPLPELAEEECLNGLGIDELCETLNCNDVYIEE